MRLIFESLSLLLPGELFYSYSFLDHAFPTASLFSNMKEKKKQPGGIMYFNTIYEFDYFKEKQAFIALKYYDQWSVPNFHNGNPGMICFLA